MKKLPEVSLIEDYKDFLQSEETQIPAFTQKKVLNQIHGLLNPNPLLVFLKILILHLIVGVMSLSICHQFDMNPFQTQHSLSDWFMQVGGHHFCMLGCGILFVGLSLLFAGYFLSREEIHALKKTEVLQTLTLGLISLGLFSAFGAQMALGLAAIWLFGGLIGGFVATETIWRIKKYS